MGHFRSFRRFLTLTAIVVLVQLIAGQAMAACGELHEHVCDHSEKQSHECIVTLMLHGGYQNEAPNIVPVDLVIEPPDVPVKLAKAIESRPSHLVGGVLAHAPPRGP
jgi:hypothetical protein